MEETPISSPKYSSAHLFISPVTQSFPRPPPPPPLPSHSMFVRVLFPSTQTHRSIISPSSTSNSSANTAKSAAFKIVGGNNYDGGDGGTNAEELVDMVRKKKSNMSNRDLTKSKRALKEADNTDDDGTSDSSANGGSIVVVCQVKLPLDIVDYETLPQTERGLYNR